MKIAALGSRAGNSGQLPGPAGGRAGPGQREPRGPSSPGTTWDPTQGFLQILVDSWAVLGRESLGQGPLTGRTWTTVSSDHGVWENCGYDGGQSPGD